MSKKIGLFWLRDDFRVTKNHGLAEATKNHDQVVVFYLYKNSTYKNQEAQKWWLSKSLIKITKTGIERLGPSVINLAEHENLDGHANSVKIRLKKEK